MNQIIQKAVEELQGYLRNWAIVEPETTLILGNVRRLLTEAYMAGRADTVEFIREKSHETPIPPTYNAYAISAELLEQAKQPVKDNN